MAKHFLQDYVIKLSTHKGTYCVTNRAPEMYIHCTTQPFWVFVLVNCQASLHEFKIMFAVNCPEEQLSCLFCLQGNLLSFLNIDISAIVLPEA